jgi:hypothetical protein
MIDSRISTSLMANNMIARTFISRRYAPLGLALGRKMWNMEYGNWKIEDGNSKMEAAAFLPFAFCLAFGRGTKLRCNLLPVPYYL